MTTKINRQKQKPKNRAVACSRSRYWELVGLLTLMQWALSLTKSSRSLRSTPTLLRRKNNWSDSLKTFTTMFTATFISTPSVISIIFFFLILSNFGHKHSVNVSEEIMILCYCIVLYCSSSLWSLLTLSSFRGKLTLSSYFYILFLKKYFFWIIQLFAVAFTIILCS